MAYTGWLIDDGKLHFACAGPDKAEVEASLAKSTLPTLVVDAAMGADAMLDELVKFARPHMSPATLMRCIAQALAEVQSATGKQMYLGWYITDEHLRLGTYGTDYDAVLNKLADVAGNRLQRVLTAGQRDVLWQWGRAQGLSEHRLVEDMEYAERNIAAVPKANG